MFLPFDGLVADLNPTIDTAAYTTGDVLFAPTKIANGTLNTQGLSSLQTILVLDAANQKSAIDLLFFNQDPGSLGDLNAAVDISTAQLAMMIGIISVLAADYATIKATTNAVASKNPALMLPALKGSKDFWVAGVARGSPDYLLATDLRIKLMIQRQG